MNLDVGIVSDWLVTYSGAEKVLSEVIKIFPQSSLYATVDFLTDENRQLLGGKKSQTSFIQKFPFAKRQYKNYLPFMPLAIEQFDVSQHELIISSSHAVAKGVLTSPHQLHISYVHSPMRYAWDLQHLYLREDSSYQRTKGLLAKLLLHKLRMWDTRTSNGVDYFVANSHYIARRIKKIYGKTAEVIYPPVDINNFPLEHQKDGYYITVSRLVSYKRIDLIVQAFAAMPDKKLVIIGDGPEMHKIKSLSTRNIEVLGYLANSDVRRYVSKAKAFIFASEEDFGIAPVEAQACGTPVIAFGRGGALETVRGLESDGPTGVFFKEQSPNAIIDAVKKFESIEQTLIDPQKCRNNSSRFAPEIFNELFKSFVEEKMDLFKSR